MGERHVGVFLLAILTAAVVVAATQSCPDGNWQVHNRTETCMKLFTTEKTFAQAREDCKGLRGGSRRDSAGHLVFIFDEETDDFVKGLLRASSTTGALIGLNDYTRVGNYQWGENEQPLRDYTGWASGNPYNSSDHTSVVITANGWEKYGTRWQASFVCQVKVVYPIPTLTCPPPAEVGQQSTITYCIIDVPAQVSISEMSFKIAQRTVVSCYSSGSCSQSQSYRATMTTGASPWSSSLQIKKVDTRDEGSWTCSVKFSNNQEVTTKPCTFKVYVLPTKVECTKRYLQSGIEVSCRTEIMYPQAVCQWHVTRRNSYIQVQQLSNMSSTHENVNGMSYYRTVCNAYVYDRSAGVYLFKVSVRPDLPGLDWDQTSAVRTGNTNVTVERPRDPPQMSYSNGSKLNSPLEVLENQTMTIKCSVNGGIPLVYSTTIQCFGKSSKINNDNFVLINITIIKDFHNLSCSCYGQHLTGATSSSLVTFLVISPPRVTSFSINKKEDKIEVAARSSINLNCTSTGYPQYQLSLLYYLDGKETWKTVNKSEVSHTMTTNCSSMGRYACLAGNNQDGKYVDLRVRCGPEYCTHTEPNPKFGVPVGSNGSFKMCVLAYPMPTSFRLFQDYPKELEKSRFNASFDYTNVATGRGEITVNIFSLTQKDLLSVYELLSGDTYLKFELVPRGPPSCPENLTVSDTFSDSVTLSWKPGFDGGLQQSFTVLRYDSGLTAAPHIILVILQPKENSEGIFSYNITGLSESTSYIFDVRSENAEGVPNCSHIQVQVSTEASPLSLNDQSLTTIVVPVVIGLILVILVVVVVFVVVRRRRSRDEKLGAVNTDSVQTSTGHAHSSIRNDGQESFYANMNSGPSTAADKESKQNNLAKSSTDQMEQDNTYAQVKNENKKKVDKRPENKKPSKKDVPEEDNTYTQVTKKNDKKGNKKKSNEKELNNEAVMYWNMSKSGAAKPDETTYANCQKSSSDGTEQGDMNKTRDDGRTVNQDGLIYAVVEINKKTTNPEIISDHVPKSQPKAKVAIKPAKSEEPGVEYVSIDFVATARQQ